MRDWSLSPGDPLQLSLAADARLCKPDYVNDHIWEVELGGTDPERSAVGLHTTFGLRARSMRIFLRFTEGNETVTDPNLFFTKPSLRRFYPNFATLDFVPLPSLITRVDYWIPESHAAAGRVTLTNKSNAVRNIRFEVCAVLLPLEGQPVIATQQQLVNVLAGQTSGIAPVIFMTGGPEHGAGAPPSLQLNLELGPGSTRTIAFAEAALDSIPEAFELARKTTARSWQAELARIEMLDASQSLDIRTGDPDWDAAFAFSQKAAHALFMSQEALPAPSFVNARHIDHGFSRRGDGSDYPPSWNGQFALDAYYLAAILPGTPHVSKNLLLNFLAVQEESGEVDGKPGLGGQRGKFLAAPILTRLAWKHYQAVEDDAFLAEVFPRLVRFFWSWFSAAHDRNRDGIPEWDNILQTGLEDNPLFDVWHPWSQGLDISFVHSPSLEAMLYQEARLLIEMAQKLGRPREETLLIEAQAEKLKTAVEDGWDARNRFYVYRDRDTGLASSGNVIAKKRGNGSMRLKFDSETPVRLLIQIETDNPSAKRPEVDISEYFTRSKGIVETIPGHRFQWRTGGLVATSQKIYYRIGRITFGGLDDKDRVNIRVIDTCGEDLSLALPLWAEIPDKEKARILVEDHLTNPERFGRPYGMRLMPSLPAEGAEVVLTSVSLPWNTLLAEGLLSYGFRAKAVHLITQWMAGIVLNLKQSGAFYQRHHAEDGTGYGERNSLHGLAPLDIFLQALGVSILSSTKVKLAGRNIFPWPVTIKYKGLTIVRGLEQTTITFFNGSSAIVKEEMPRIVEI